MNGLLQRYDSLSARLRAMHVEHMELIHLIQKESEENKNDPREIGALRELNFNLNLNKERLKELEFEMPHLLKRHKLQWNAILAAETTIGILVLSMFEIGFHAITHIDWMQMVAMFTLMAGALVFFICIMITAFEFAFSPKSVVFEVQHGLKLSQ
ncbi:hypothetical protein KDW_01000 [Dictyobacter vulcani]|uniref:DUF2721 domain-containing protein n=2 Tax=Dictyobacter vulcani TaxID=2607529 RepID=A0A5J4KBM3_9CHLR|nr:hypothetical protein KDW_01000 [Dictyobacter vulcani]